MNMITTTLMAARYWLDLYHAGLLPPHFPVPSTLVLDPLTAFGGSSNYQKVTVAAWSEEQWMQVDEYLGHSE